MQFDDIVSFLSGLVVIAFGLFLIGIAVLIVATPARAEGFFRGFARSARTHYAEQGVRLVVGVAMVSSASVMRYPEFFSLFGWVIVVSTTVLLLIPWQWHHKFSALVMPRVFRRMGLFALGAAALGALVLYSVSRVVGL